MTRLEMGRGWIMLHADCLDIFRDVGERCVDHVITDPPYGFGAYATDKTVDISSLFLVSDSVAVFGYPETLVAWCIQAARTPLEWVTWHPSNAEAKAGARSATALPRLVECIAIFADKISPRRIRRERAESGARFGGVGEAALGDVWTDASPGVGFNSRQRLHPNEKPVTLMMKLIELLTDPGETVLDPFAGSGTTGVACLRLGREFVGIERDARYFALACERLRAEERGSTVVAARAGQVSIFDRVGT